MRGKDFTNQVFIGFSSRWTVKANNQQTKAKRKEKKEEEKKTTKSGQAFGHTIGNGETNRGSTDTNYEFITE